jgi:hypothetical protein
VLQPASPDLGNAKTALLAALAVFAVGYIVVLISGVSRARRAAALAAKPGQSTNPGPAVLATGFFRNFWDTLGIGSYATTTAIFRFWRLVPDEQIPGTLNVGHTLPTIIQAFIFMLLTIIYFGMAREGLHEKEGHPEGATAHA